MSADPFESLLEAVVPGAGHRGLDDNEAPPIPRALGLEPRDVIARGGTGWVIRAWDPLLEREVAVKVARPDLGEPAREALVEEARLCARLQHPAVLPVHRLHLDAESAALVYTLAPRLTLASILFGRHRRLLAGFDAEARLSILADAAGAVIRAHDLGVLHGDLHPGNVVQGPNAESYILDWSGGKASHPGYAAPERLRGEVPSAAGDVFSMAAVAWELCTLNPFRVRRDDEDLSAFIGRHADGQLPAHGPEAAIGELLLPALDPDPARRPTARAWVGEIRLLLTGRGERRRREQESRHLVVSARDALEEYGVLGEGVAEEQRVLAALRGRVLPHAALEQKRTLWESEDRLRERMIGQELIWLRGVEEATRAVTLDPARQEAKALLAELWWARFRQAEPGGSPAEITAAARQVQAYDEEQRYLRVLQSPALLSLSADREGAVARLGRFVERDRVLVPELTEEHPLPIERLALEPGSWMVVIRAPGVADARFPVSLRRREHLKAAVRMLEPARIGEGWVHMPAGPFHMGSDSLARQFAWRASGRGPVRAFHTGGDPLAKQAVDGCTPTVGDRFVMRHPVTSAEYLSFLQDIGPEEAARHVPGEAGLYPDFRPLWLLAGGRWSLPDDWDPRWPVMAVNLQDCKAYAAWLSARTGRRCRLPTEEEWEKAARGVDGRAYPWGQACDPTFARMRSSVPEGPRPCAVGQYPVDTSVWGCMDMAGLVREWTASLFDAAEYVVRGGAWNDDSDELRCAGRRGLLPGSRSSAVGFRLVSEEAAPTDR